jgi:hypothetical protein
MRRRKNFFGLGVPSKGAHEVNIYIHGKDYARGGRNVKTRTFSSRRAAVAWAVANDDYPEVEVIEVATGEIIHSVGTGRVGNPRKTRKPRRATQRVSRPRSNRSNPPEDHEQATAEGRIKTTFRNWNKEILKRDRKSPTPSMHDGDMQKQIIESAEILVATQHPELRSDAMEGTPAIEVAQRILMLSPGGTYAKFSKSKKFADVFVDSTMEIAEAVEDGRKVVSKSDASTKRTIKASKKKAATRATTTEAARIKRLEAEAAKLRDEMDETMPADVAAELAEEYSDTERELSLAEAPEPEDLYEPSFLKQRSGSEAKIERLGQYSDFLSPVRSDVRAPLAMLGKAREDILLYRLSEGTTQVYMKGAMTVTFEPSAKLSSETIAHRYANKWRGLKPSGAVDADAKKRRLATAVYLGVEGKSSVKLIEKPIALVKRGDRKADRKQYPMPDLDSYELKGPRANPRRRKNTGWPAKIGPYKLKEVTDEYTWDRKNRHELATYGPFLIRSWSRDYYPDYWTVTMTGTPAVREAWGEVYGGRVMYAKADAIGFLDEHLRACGNPHNRANPRRRRNYVAPSGGERKTRVFFMETRGKKYNVKVYKAGSVYEVVIYERGAPSESFITSDKNEVWATVGQFYKVGHMTGTAKYRVKQDNLGLGIE